MVIMPLTTRQAFIAVVHSIGQLLVALLRDLRHFCALYNRGYESRNYQWRSYSEEPSEKDED